MDQVNMFSILERVLQSDNTIWMSPNGAHMVYAEIDDTHVTQYQSTFYGDPKKQYSTVTTQRYPKVNVFLNSKMYSAKEMWSYVNSVLPIIWIQ